MSAKQKFQIHARLAKYDADTHTFEAIATDETIDKVRERMNYDRSKPHFEAWANEFAKATDGQSVGNVRSMHGKVASGKLTSMVLDDASKAIIVRGEVVDTNDQVKCSKGIYTGVSIGGDILDRWADEANKGVFWYEAAPFEVSLVDNPCNPNARFLKMAGGVETEEPLVGDPEKAAVDALAKVLDAGTIKPSEVLAMIEAAKVKAEEAGKVEKRQALKAILSKPDVTVGEIEAQAAIWLPEAERAGDAPALIGALFKAGGFSAEELAEIEKTAPAPAQEAPREARKLVSAEDVAASLKRAQTLGDPATALLQKGLYGLASLAQLLESLHWAACDALSEAAYEADGSTVGLRLKALCGELGELVCEMAEEETQELAEKATFRGTLAKSFEKVGARHSKTDADRLQKIHDHSVDMGAKCSGAKGTIGGELHKLLGVSDDEGFAKAVTVLREKANKWDSQPVRKGVTRILGKGEEAQSHDETELPAAVVEKVRAAKSGDSVAHIWCVQNGFGDYATAEKFAKIK